jgi:pimeloyl-ACP methyl ester carboxylesterase
MARPNLLILPGLLEDADAFQPLATGLSDVATLLVADLTRANTIAALAQDALRQAPAGKFLLAGHSMGGYVALEVMRQAPQRVSALALLNTNARPDTPESTENRRRLMALADRDFAAVPATLMPKLMTPRHLEDAVLTGIIGSMALAVGKDAFKRQEEAIIGRIDSRPHLKDIRCRTLVIAARHDQLMPVEILEELADGIPGARLAIVEDSGHMSTIEQPERVVALMREWVTGENGSAAGVSNVGLIPGAPT